MTLYLRTIGYTARRPADYPALDRAALMRDAHRIAKDFRQYFGGYRKSGIGGDQ